MEVAKEKMKDMVSKAREKNEVRNVKLEEKEEKKAAKSREEKEIIHQLSKALQAEAKMKYHLEKAEHRAQTLFQRSSETNRVSAHSVSGDGSGGSGEGGVPVMSGSGDGGVEEAVPQPGGSDGTSMYGGTTASPTGDGAGDVVRGDEDMPARPSSMSDEN